VRRAPEPGPVRGDRVELYDLFFNAPSPSLRGTEGEVSATPHRAGRGLRIPH
jgi:hypothetical protein